MDVDSSRAYSFSKLNTYKDCPRRYRYRYVDRLPPEGRTIETFLGTCAHGALEELYRGLQHGRVMTREEFLGLFESAWSGGWGKDISIHDKDLSPEDVRRKGAEFLGEYYERHAPFEDGKAHEVEKKLGVDLEVDVDGEKAACRIEGFIDRLSFPRSLPGVVEIHDYKTGSHLPTQDDVDALMQFDVYAMLVRSQYPEAREVRVILHFLRFGRELSPSRPPLEDRSARTRAGLAELIRAIKRDHAWEPRRSHLCDWCGYRPICPLWAHVEAVKAMAPAARRRDDGVRLVDKLSGLEKRRRELREEMKAIEKEEAEVHAGLLEFVDAARAGASEKAVVVAGTDGEAVVTEKHEIKLPTKTHAPEKLAELEGELKLSPLWRDVSHLDAHLLLEGLRERRWAPDALETAEALVQRFGRESRERHVRYRRRRGEEEAG